MGGAPAPVTDDRTFAEIIADVPDCPSDEHNILLDSIEEWLTDTTREPPGGWDGFYLDCSAALTDMNAAGAVIRSLIEEFKGTRHARSLHTKGLADLHVHRGYISEAKPPLEKAIRALKERRKADAAAHPPARWWSAAPASVIALRDVDVALELWRDDEGRAGEVLDRINDAVAAYYDAHEPAATG